MSSLGRRRYCVFGCTDLGAYMHGFPHPGRRLEMFQKWVSIVGNKLKETDTLKIYKNKKVCSYHFSLDQKVASHRLKISAVPSLYLDGDLQETEGQAENRLQIYTDGSKIEGKVGAGVTYIRDGTEVRARKIKLEPYCTVFQAEMCAISRAIADAAKMPDRCIEILSDSRSSLEMLRRRTCFHPIAFEIMERLAHLTASGKIVQFSWVRAHVGTEGNERADQLAKEAALKLKTRPDYDGVPVSFAKRKLREETLEAWQCRYESGETGAVTRTFMPDVRRAYDLVRVIHFLPRHVQVLTGHGGFSHYLHRFGLKDSPGCVCDPDVHETVLHLILECPKYGLIRLNLETETRTNLTTDNLPHLLQNEKHRPLLMSFFDEILRDVLPRNGSKNF